jgi:hypothetical protein
MIQIDLPWDERDLLVFLGNGSTLVEASQQMGISPDAAGRLLAKASARLGLRRASQAGAVLRAFASGALTTRSTRERPQIESSIRRAARRSVGLPT